MGRSMGTGGRTEMGYQEQTLLPGEDIYDEGAWRRDGRKLG